MMNGLFTAWAPTALAALLALLLVRAVVTDLRERIIHDELNIAIALLAPLFWWATGLSLWPGVAVQLGLAFAVFTLFALVFHLGGMGGGDVKLAAALALWFSPPVMLELLVIMSLAGGVLTLVVLLRHKRQGAEGRPEVPYGVAIALGAWAILAERFLNHFG